MFITGPLTLFEIPLGLINVIEDALKNELWVGWALILVRVAGLVTVTGPEVLGSPGLEKVSPSHLY